MVALMVFLTLIACVAVDLVLINLRKRREQAAQVALQHELVFAQDGGKPVEKEEKTESEE